MKKKINMPSFLFDYGSIWNPLILAFYTNVMFSRDKYHVNTDGVKLDLPSKIRTPMVDVKILEAYGARRFNIEKNEILFLQESEALHYYQLLQGSVKMITTSADGQEFIQGIFRPGDSFGEPPLFCDFPYPSTAIAMENSELMRLPKQNFLTLLKDNFEIHLMFDRVLCNRLKYKSMVLSDISFHDPEQRISNLLKYIKESSSIKRKEETRRENKSFIVPFTRQQIADMSGLRVETVIRTVKKMQRMGKLDIVGRKISI